MTDQSIKAKQALIQQLREVAEKETAWLEKNRLLYTEKGHDLLAWLSYAAPVVAKSLRKSKSSVSMLPYMNLNVQRCGIWRKRLIGKSRVWRR